MSEKLTDKSTMPRARGVVELDVRATPRGTALAHLRQSGSFRALFPRDHGQGLQAVLINTAGGITGGDRFSLLAKSAANSRLTLTTQAAERVYRALPNQVARVKNRLVIGQDARLNWLPQETILFDGSALRRDLHVEMAPNASLLLVEPLVFGRAAMHEVLENINFSDRIEIRQDGQLVYLDAQRFDKNCAVHLARPFVAAGMGAMANIIYLSHDAEAQLLPVRAILGQNAGASLLQKNMLVLRLLAPDSYLLRQTLLPVLKLLNKDTLPRCWTT